MGGGARLGRMTYSASRTGLRNDADSGSRRLSIEQARTAPAGGSGLKHRGAGMGYGIAIMNCQAEAPYLPVQQGARFSRKAVIPSWASAAKAFIDMTSLA